ncbi:MAG: RpoD subfamily polymerase sigma-70 subunit, polymerase primary sigma factor [Parcubacteria group bacterium]|nr:RpoD subfamily polymerase sigma-70 subunit, polymerase primary sigma factor [Parcubacteria group bacterium]
MAKNSQLTKYLEEISRSPLIKAEEEKALARKGDDESKKKLAEGNLRLVARIAQKYEGTDPNVSIMDLIAEGNLGLYKAVDMYVKHGHHGKDYKFSTYATWWIRQAMQSKLGINEEPEV